MGSFDFGGIAALANEEGRVAQAGPNAYAQQQQLGIERQQAAQEKQLNDQKIQQQQIQLDDQKASSAAMHEWDGKDMNALPGLMIKHGASANAVFSMKNGVLDYASKQSTKAKTDLENDKALHDEVAGALSPGTDPKQVSDADLPNWIRSTGKSLLDGGKIDPQHEATVEQLAQLPPEQARQQLEVARKGFMAQSQINDELAKKAEAGMNDAKSKLDAAQAEAANYKEDPNLGLIDLRTKQPVSPNALAPLGPGEAEVLGKKPGDMVPLKLKNTANEIVNRGIHVTSANGRQIMVDGQGNTIKDLGTAPAVVNFNMQNAGAAADASGNPSEIAKAIAENRMKWSEAVSARTPQATKNAIMAQVFKLNPNYDTAEFGLETDAAKKARSGAWADTRVAYNTAIDHADQLLAAADALKNGDVKKLNSLKNYFATQFGSPDVSNFSAIANAYNHEVTGVVAKNHITDAEVAAGHAVLPDKASPDQIKGVAQAYKKLMSSKRDELDKVIRAGAGNKANAVLDVKSNQDQGGGQPTGHKVGDLISQHGRTFKATKVDANGKVLAADPQ
jgi:hypothetical protein